MPVEGTRWRFLLWAVARVTLQLVKIPLQSACDRNENRTAKPGKTRGNSDRCENPTSSERSGGGGGGVRASSFNGKGGRHGKSIVENRVIDNHRDGTKRAALHDQGRWSYGFRCVSAHRCVQPGGAALLLDLYPIWKISMPSVEMAGTVLCSGNTKWN